MSYHTLPNGAIVSRPKPGSRWRCKRDGRIVEVRYIETGSSRVVIRNLATDRTTTVSLDRFHGDYEREES